MLVRVSEPRRLVDLIVFLRSSGFLALDRERDGVARVYTPDEPRVRELLALWEQQSGVNAHIIRS
jgi:hypothetical protein